MRFLEEDFSLNKILSEGESDIVTNLSAPVEHSTPPQIEIVKGGSQSGASIIQLYTPFSLNLKLSEVVHRLHNQVHSQATQVKIQIYRWTTIK